MSFNSYAKRVRSEELPLGHRRIAFRNCVNSYSYLNRRSFTETLARLNEESGLDRGTTPEKLIKALEALETERNQFLKKLKAFERKRIRDKSEGRGSLSKAALEELYS